MKTGNDIVQRAIIPKIIYCKRETREENRGNTQDKVFRVRTTHKSRIWYTYRVVWYKERIEHNTTLKWLYMKQMREI